MQEVSSRLQATISFTRTTGSFLECFLVTRAGERLEMDFARDAPFRFSPTVYRPEVGFLVDNPLDMACNKLSALYDRTDPKDFVDVYFIHHQLFSLEELLPKAQQKHVGLDSYWLAQAFARITDITHLPRMIKPVTLEQLRFFFTDKIRWLMQEDPPASEYAGGPDVP